MRRNLLIAIATVIAISVYSQSKYPKPFVTKAERPAPYSWIPHFPEVTKGEFSTISITTS